jgi:hypothetical protein
LPLHAQATHGSRIAATRMLDIASPLSPSQSAVQTEPAVVCELNS